MGLNKRYVDLESMLRAYKTDSIQGIHRYLSAEVIIGNPDCSHIIDLYLSDEYDELVFELESLIKKIRPSD